jgi:hypothetical protein
MSIATPEEITMAHQEQQTIDRLAERYAISASAVSAALAALRGGGGMAQFSHPDFGGMAQWSPGMTMVGDMFNTDLKAKLDGVCTELTAYLADAPAGDTRAEPDSKVSYRSGAAASDWWPDGLGAPGAVGSQNDLRYAVFPSSRRLVIDDQGRTTVYDTGDHQIHGVAQAQSSDRTLSFTSQNGLVSVDSLSKVGG